MAKVHYYLQNNSGYKTTVCGISHCDSPITYKKDKVTCHNCLRTIRNYECLSLFDYNEFKKSKEFIFSYSEVNVWNIIKAIPDRFIYDFFKIWNEGITFAGRKIEIDETDQFYRLIKIN